MAAVDQAETVTERDRRAAAEAMAVVPHAPEMYRVYSGTDAQYIVDVRNAICECADWEYRRPSGGCKHIRRVRMALGEREIPAGVCVDPALTHQREAFADA